jgi:hypothetical protein
MAAMRSRLALGVALAVAFFALGVLVTRWLSAPPAAPGASATPAGAGTEADAGTEVDAHAKDPLIIFDPSTLDLLPDASLRLDLPPRFDEGQGGSTTGR